MANPRNDTPPEQDAFGKPPIVQQIDVAEVMRTLGEFKRSIDDALRRVGDLERMQFVDQTSRDSVTLLTATVAAINTRLTTQENRTYAYSEITGTHDNTDHTTANAVLWSQIGSIPSSNALAWSQIGPGTHGSSAHDSSVAATSDLTSMKSTYNGHVHSIADIDTNYSLSPGAQTLSVTGASGTVHDSGLPSATM